MSPRVFPNLKRTYKYRNMGMWEHIKVGELPLHNSLGIFCWGRSLNIGTEIKRELL
jgi:hypothetical protein